MIDLADYTCPCSDCLEKKKDCRCVDCLTIRDFCLPSSVHLKKCKNTGQSLVEYDIYIGKSMKEDGWDLEENKWAPPKKWDSKRDRFEQLLEYEKHIRSRPDLMAALPELQGKKLGCWCAPAYCHGDVLAKLLSQKKDYATSVLPLAWFSGFGRKDVGGEFFMFVPSDSEWPRGYHRHLDLHVSEMRASKKQ